MVHASASNAEILKAVERHAHPGAIDGMLSKSKLRHGAVSPRQLKLRASSRLQQYGDGAAVVAYFMPHAGAQQVSLWPHPHGLLPAPAVVCVGLILVALLVSIARFLGSWDASPAIA